MKKVFLLGCMMLFVFCAPKQSTVQTEGLEEVIVFGEGETEETYVSSEPVLPEPVEEEVVAPPISEEEPVLPPVEEEIVAPPIIETEPVLPPVEEEVAVLPPPIAEESLLPPVIEEEPTSFEEPILPPPITETPPMITEEPITPTPPPPTPAPATILGYRVQIFASSTQQNASRVAGDARTTFGNAIYVDHVPPYYKVRVGNCLTKQEADVLKGKALQAGYRGAFVVETMITP